MEADTGGVVVKQIRIACEGVDTLLLDEIEPFQGELKERTEEDIEKVVQSVERYGFSFPFFIWKTKTMNYCLDGHGRLEALMRMRDELGYEIPPLPVAYVQAKSRKEAKQKLLRMNSQYGEITREGLLEFTEDIEVEWTELSLADGLIDVDGVVLDEKKLGEYSRKIEVPIYEPTGEEPDVVELYDAEKAERLITDIRDTEIEHDLAEFLELAAMRHVVFDYGKIAEYYAHASPEVQRLMEDSALVIIDFKKAIENGFVRISADLAEQWMMDNDEG